jgi:hypothetical protein
MLTNPTFIHLQDLRVHFILWFMNVFFGQILDIVLWIMDKPLIEETLQSTNKFWKKDTAPVYVESPIMLDMIPTH